MRANRILPAAVLAAALVGGPGYAQSTEDLVHRLDRLEQENRDLRRDLEAMRAAKAPAEDHTETASETIKMVSDQGLVGINSAFSYAMLDPTVAGKSKPTALLQARQAGQMKPGRVYLGGSLIAVADYQTSNFYSDFGYLMRQPGANHIGKTSSEAVLHSAQISLTAPVTSWLTAYAELLYDPQQSFGAGTITSLGRNQVQLRRGYVLVGDLSRWPVYGMIGKIDSAFGQTDSVNPFSLSTDWHTFSGLSYGALIGYSKDGLNLTAQAVQGGAQFRGLNAPVAGTNVPSRLNNFVIDANYRYSFSEAGRSLLAGASYEHASAYCQDFPVQHFGTCAKANPAYAVYTRLDWDALTLRGEYMQTVHALPGTHNPNPPLDVFAASRVTSYDLGAKYRARLRGLPLDLSFDFSTLIAGPKGAPWEHQDQWVAGLAVFPKPNVKLFSEIILVNGYVPLNFISGGIPGEDPGDTESDIHKRSRVLVTGINLAF